MPIGLRVIVLGGVNAMLCAQGLGTLNGIVINGSRPAAQANVEAENLDTHENVSRQTDSNGRFTMGGLAPGTYRFSVTIEKRPTMTFSPDSTLKEGSQSIRFTVPNRSEGGLQVVPRPGGAEKSPVSPDQFRQVSDRAASVGNGSSLGVTSTAFGLIIALLRDPAIAPGGNSTLSVEFVPFSSGTKGFQNAELEFSPKPRPDSHLTFEIQSSPPARTVGNQVWIWTLKAAADFSGSDVLVDVGITLKDENGKVVDHGSATTPRLSLKHLDRPSWIATYKDIIGPATAAFVTAALGFIAGVVRKKKKAAKPPPSDLEATANLFGTSASADGRATPQRPNSPSSGDFD